MQIGAQILLSEPYLHCLFNFLEKARPCLLFFSAICLPSLIKDTERIVMRYLYFSLQLSFHR